VTDTNDRQGPSLDSLPCPVIVADNEGRIDRMNEAAARLSCRSGSSARAAAQDQEVKAASDWLTAELHAFAATGAAYRMVENRLPIGEGFQTFKVHFSRLVDDGGANAGTVVVLDGPPPPSRRRASGGHSGRKRSSQPRLS